MRRIRDVALLPYDCCQSALQRVASLILYVCVFVSVHSLTKLSVGLLIYGVQLLEPSLLLAARKQLIQTP